MTLTTHILKAVEADPARLASAAAELCHRSALDACAEGDLFAAMRASFAARQFERLAAMQAALMAGAISAEAYQAYREGKGPHPAFNTTAALEARKLHKKT